MVVSYYSTTAYHLNSVSSLEQCSHVIVQADCMAGFHTPIAMTMKMYVMYEPKADVSIIKIRVNTGHIQKYFIMCTIFVLGLLLLLYLQYFCL